MITKVNSNTKVNTEWLALLVNSRKIGFTLWCMLFIFLKKWISSKSFVKFYKFNAVSHLEKPAVYSFWRGRRTSDEKIKKALKVPRITTLIKTMLRTLLLNNYKNSYLLFCAKVIEMVQVLTNSIRSRGTFFILFSYYVDTFRCTWLEI